MRARPNTVWFRVYTELSLFGSYAEVARFEACFKTRTRCQLCFGAEMPTSSLGDLHPPSPWANIMYPPRFVFSFRPETRRHTYPQAPRGTVAVVAAPAAAAAGSDTCTSPR